MAITVTVLYANVLDGRVDVQKYLTGHAPKVIKEMGPFGLRGVRAVQLHGSPIKPGADKQYLLQVALDWDSLEAFNVAFKATSEKLMADIDSFSNLSPLIMYGEIILEEKFQFM
ncbi:uncharacterized protein A1O5_10768 [Cladophialophora psammophila CBS 110553]|uniref:EthD domain-containing protein n=1 Tax=Cladophialophora psammophila CBS 110553 TaxID=1182543 RepID=W9WDG4_9EURO|nr:uncharacterized protein A1O5_10768 [Cladophialophora psammophila CBS 110553]EXJ66152.1 hypothetical protein A1O5_10768 [Cladophialophora psammophila CBS 110553]